MTDLPDETGVEIPIVLEPTIPLLMCSFDCSSEETKECIKCKRLFCQIHSSRVSPNICQDCFKAFSLIIDRFERRVEDYDDKNDTVLTRKESCKRLKFDGPDWVFYTGWIDTLNDDELKTAWEFHFFIMKIIEHDNETRKIKHNANIRSKGGMFSGVGITTTTSTRTKREVKPKDPKKELRKQFPKITDEAFEKMWALIQG
jgi:hypothetical protein